MFISDIDTRLPSGAMRGRTLREVWAFQPSYVSWLHDKTMVSDEAMSELINMTYGDRQLVADNNSAANRDPQLWNNFTDTTAGGVTNATNSTTIKPKKESKMKNITDTIRNNVTEETLDMVQVHIGRTIYDLAKTHAAPLLPKFTWYEKLFTSKAKRDTATLLAVYIGMHLLRTKFDHYALECLTVYVNYELQATAFGTLNSEVINKLLTAPKVK